MSKKGILFGLNGSLFNLDEIARSVLAEVLQSELQKESFPISNFFSFKQLVLTVNPKIDHIKYENMTKVFIKRFIQKVEELDLNKTRYLQEFKEDYSFYLISSLPNEIVFYILEKSNCFHCFDIVLGMNDIKELFPQKDYYKPAKSFHSPIPTLIHQDSKRLRLAQNIGLGIKQIENPEQIESYLLNPK